MAALEDEGLTTAKIRNSVRRREARLEREDDDIAGSADIPKLFSCCGVGLAFGDATEENDAADREYRRDQYFEAKKARAEHESELRQQYKKQAVKQAGRRRDVDEAYEVVE